MTARAVSAGFLRAIAGSHAMAVQATALSTFQTGVSPTGTDVPVADGDVVLDATADVRGTLDLTTDGTGWDPRPGNHILQPYGTEIFVRRGVQVAGSIEWVSLGYYRIQSAARNKRTGQLAVTGSDRMQAIADATLPTPVQFAVGTSIQSIFTQLVTDIYPSATIDFDYTASADTISTALTATDDRYSFLRDLAYSRGKIMYWDYRGHLAVGSLPAASAADWTVAAGQDGVLIDLTETLDRQNVANAVIATGDGGATGTPPVAIAYDSDPSSPTYYYGPFGKVPYQFSSSLLTSSGRAMTAAQLLLSKMRGLPYQADFSAVPNPAMQPLDTLAVTYPGGPAASHILQQVTIPLTAAAPLTATTREQGGQAPEVVDMTTSTLGQ